MDILIAILTAGLTSGALYALATVGLSLVWGSMGMLNMAHGGLLALGGYIAYASATGLGLPVPLAVLASFAVGALGGLVLYLVVVRKLLRGSPANFETNVLIATVGVGIALENGILLVFGGQPLKQPLYIEGLVSIGNGAIAGQNLLIIAMAVVLMAAVAGLLNHTKMGMAIRATAQNRDAAQLMGVPIERVYAQVLGLSGLLAAACGILVSSITQLTPTLGADPMLKAFIMCVVAGLGNLPGAVIASFALAVTEAVIQYVAGARWGFPSLMLIVIVVLIWRPNGLFGKAQIRRM